MSNENRLNPKDFLRVLKTLPKAELHLHLEGTLTPELMLKCAQRNNITLSRKTLEEIREHYNFKDLQSFLDVYYEASRVLCTKNDFYDLTYEYLVTAHHDGISHVEVFFDPQAHIERGVSFSTFFSGIYEALIDGQREFGISFYIIMSFLRHLPESDAFKILEMALPYKDKIIAVGLDSSELGNPPEKFAGVFKKSIEHGFLTVAHAGEEGPATYIWNALHHLQVKRIDHGVRCAEDPVLMKHLLENKIPLTVCPISNVKLGAFASLEKHNLKYLFDSGLCVTINSDDPSFFGATLLENYIQVYQKLAFSLEEMCQLAKNSFQASFLPQSQKQHFVNLIDQLY